MVLLAIPVTPGRLIPLMVLVPLVPLPAREIFRALVVVVPAVELLVKDSAARLSLVVPVVRVSDSFPDDRVKSPLVRVSLPWVRVKFLVAAIVVSPLIETAPEEVLNNPVEEEASKLPPV